MSGRARPAVGDKHSQKDSRQGTARDRCELAASHTVTHDGPEATGAVPLYSAIPGHPGASTTALRGEEGGGHKRWGRGEVSHGRSLSIDLAK